MSLLLPELFCFPGEIIYPKFSKNYPTLLEKFKNQADFSQIGKKLLDFLLRV